MSSSSSSLRALGVGLVVTTSAITPGIAQTPLSDKPVFASVPVPGNLALALSVEYPTAVSNAHTDTTYTVSSTYLGYFDPEKCYDYKLAAGGLPEHFAPAGKAANHVCNGKWSGNFLNWATMQTIDPFRWALTGGYRLVDTKDVTILEKANASGQGNTGNFPDRSVAGTDAANVVKGATPLGWQGMRIRVQGLQSRMRFSRSDPNDGSKGVNAFDPTKSNWPDNQIYDVYIRVRVCDESAAAGGLEANCKLYPSQKYKPEGLIQQYSNQIRFSAFGYLNDGSLSRDGGVLRARQKFVGPTQPVPGGLEQLNKLPEWKADDGTMIPDPDPDDSLKTGAFYGIKIENSGVMNYLNKFGQGGGSYKTYDPVGELYYAALRYYRNLGNVSTWTSKNGASKSTLTTWADGFPVITDWEDPIQHSCQRNFILGIGDVNTHADRNLPNATGNSEPARPAEINNDKLETLVFTNKVGQLHGLANLGSTQPYGGCCNNNGALIAGLAYYANTQDIRPDDPGKHWTAGMQTVQTYWLDVLEFSSYEKNNQFYLATKYGGFTVPPDFNPLTRGTDIEQGWWHTGPASDTVGGQLRPDTYFTAAKADQMVSGLSKAFASIASRMKAYSTAFSLADQVTTASGVSSYATLYDATDWSGEVVASKFAVTGGTKTTQTEAWKFSEKLAAQAAGDGWDKGRYIATYDPAKKAAIPFRLGSLNGSQKTALDTTYGGGNDAQEYLNYLRGDRSNEKNSTTQNAKGYRVRSNLVGDIVNSKVTVVSPPNLALSDMSNAGYAAYRTAQKDRPNVLVVGTNAGIIHVIDGSLSGPTAGKELFAYVPSAVYNGPSGTPKVNGLQAVGNPEFEHYYFVDGRPTSADVDFGKTGGANGAPDWRTIVVGGLGKGGKSLYALDLTDVSSIDSEPEAAGKVLWEFSDPDLGFVFARPVITKTARHGWVVIVASGYNNTGKGFIFIIDPKTGATLQKIALPTGGAPDAGDDGTAQSPTGLSQLTPFYPDLNSLLVESIYGGDLKGNVWRLDLRNTSTPYPAPVKVVRATDATGKGLPITTEVLPVVQPESNRRFLAFGTGKLLAASDIAPVQTERFYAVIDGTAGAFNTPSTLPAGMSFPINNTWLKKLTDVKAGVTLDLSTEIGWYLELPTGYRVINDPAYYLGTVAFAATVPTATDPCNPSGISRVYALDLGRGQTQLVNDAEYLSPGFAVTDLVVVDTKDGISLGISGSNPPQPKTCPPGATCSEEDACPENSATCFKNLKPGKGLTPRILNWREVPLRNNN